MRVTKQEIYEGFGIDSEEGAAGADDAGKAGTSETQGAEESPDASDSANMQDDAGKAGTSETQGAEESPDASDSANMQDDAGKAEESEKHAQTPEQRKENAARRRFYEQRDGVGKPSVDMAVAAALAEERRQNEVRMAEFFDKAQLVNPITGAPIKGMAEFDSWQRENYGPLVQQDVQSGRLTEDGLSRAIAEHPAVKEAGEMVRRQQEQEAERMMQADIAEISRLDPSVKGLGDILDMPTGKDFHEAVMRGNSMLDAFKLANWGRLGGAAAAAEAAKRQAEVGAQGKNHLSMPSKPRGSGGLQISKEELALYREFNPDDDEKTIRSVYGRGA